MSTTMPSAAGARPGAPERPYAMPLTRRVWAAALALADHTMTRIDELLPWRYAATTAQQPPRELRQTRPAGRSCLNSTSRPSTQVQRP
jgi:hypothetical protein